MKKMKSPQKTLLSCLFNLIVYSLIIQVLLTGCGKSEDLVPGDENLNENSIAVKEVISLEETSPLITTLKNAPDVATLNPALGTPNWSMAKFVTYTNTGTSAIIVPMSDIRSLIAYTTSNPKHFKVLMIDIIPNQSSEANNGFTGEINFFSSSGKFLEGGYIENDELVANRNTSNALVRNAATQCCLIIAIDPTRVTCSDSPVTCFSVYGVICSRTCSETL